MSSAPGIVRRLYPYRGTTGGTHNEYASVPRAPFSGGTPAHAAESAACEPRHHECVPLGLRVPSTQATTCVRHTEKASRYQVENEACARIILADPAKYPDGSLPAVWAALVLAKAQPTVTGPLFQRRAA
jgi:hypothetical protein